jgi:hypothetical protein
MGNGAIENGAKVKEFFKDVREGIKNGLNTILDVSKQVIGTPGVMDLINAGTTTLGVPLPVGNMISTGIDFASNLLGGGSKKRALLKDPNKYDFKSSVDQFNSVIKRKK